MPIDPLLSRGTCRSRLAARLPAAGQGSVSMRAGHNAIVTAPSRRPPDHERLRAIAAETVHIIQTGRYGSIELADDIARAADGTRLHLPSDPLPTPEASGPARVEVTLESTLAAGRRLGSGTAALVFASARKPGGG